eukprot:scaffold221472_cov27-Tisochrysis_lutea.AAC.1
MAWESVCLAASREGWVEREGVSSRPHKASEQGLEMALRLRGRSLDGRHKSLALVELGKGAWEAK